MATICAFGVGLGFAAKAKERKTHSRAIPRVFYYPPMADDFFIFFFFSSPSEAPKTPVSLRGKVFLLPCAAIEKLARERHVNQPQSRIDRPNAFCASTKPPTQSQTKN